MDPLDALEHLIQDKLHLFPTLNEMIFFQCFYYSGCLIQVKLHLCTTLNNLSTFPMFTYSGCLIHAKLHLSIT